MSWDSPAPGWLFVLVVVVALIFIIVRDEWRRARTNPSHLAISLRAMLDDTDGWDVEKITKGAVLICHLQRGNVRLLLSYALGGSCWLQTYPENVLSAADQRFLLKTAEFVADGPARRARQQIIAAINEAANQR